MNPAPAGVLLLHLAAVTAHAVAPPAPTLSLQEAIGAALRNGVEVKLAEAGVMSARAERQAAGLIAPGNPTLRAASTSDAAFADDGERALEVELSQEFWAPGQRGARVAAADAGLQAAIAERDWALRRTVADTALAHARAATAVRKEASVAELQEVLLQLDSAVAARLQVGEVSQLERNQVLLETTSAAGELAALRGEVAAAVQDLELRTGVPLDSATELTGELAPLDWSSFESLARTAEGRPRPDLDAAALRLEQAEREVVVQKRERRPRPSVFVGWESERTILLGDDFEGFPFPADDVRFDDEGRHLTLGVEVAIPVFDRNQGGIASALAGRVRSEAELLVATRRARADLARLLAQGRGLAALGDALAAAPTVAAESLETLRRAWAVGEIDLATLLRERERVQRARIAAEDVRLAVIETQLEIAAAVGALELFGLPVPIATDGSLPEQCP